MGAITHGLIDACTSYGTLLYWPISHHRESWDIISIIDPIFIATRFAYRDNLRFSTAALLRNMQSPLVWFIWA